MDVELNTGDTAWILAASALVLLMTPGVAFFYGCTVRATSVLNLMMTLVAAIGGLSIQWFGFAL